MATTASRSSLRASFVRRMTTRQVSVDVVGDIPERDLARFRLALRDLRTLGAVLDWLRAQEPPRTVHEIVTQDEYTHDVVVRWNDRQGSARELTLAPSQPTQTAWFRDFRPGDALTCTTDHLLQDGRAVHVGAVPVATLPSMADRV